MDKQIENRIEQLLREKVGIREICRREKVSNTLVYKVGELTGAFHITPKEPREEDLPKTVAVDDFVCPGITGCVTCKRIFQYPCPMWSKDL